MASTDTRTNILSLGKRVRAASTLELFALPRCLEHARARARARARSRYRQVIPEARRGKRSKEARLRRAE